MSGWGRPSEGRITLRATCQRAAPHKGPTVSAQQGLRLARRVLPPLARARRLLDR